MATFLHYFQTVLQHEKLSAEEAESALELVFSGQVPAAQLAGFLTALRMREGWAAEFLGFARAMRAQMRPVTPDLGGRTMLDTCGTGGDGFGTFNISTTAAFVVAGAGVPVAKHGNRSITSRSGSADVLEALGVKILEEPAAMAQALSTCGFSFLFAPALHPGMKHVQPVRRELKVKTIFNYLGPMANPAGAQAQLIGVPDLQVAGWIAEALSQLGLARAYVVCGSDGLDEITLSGDTTVYAVTPGQVETQVWVPEDFGLRRASLEAVLGGDAAENAAIALAILQGQETGPKLDITLLNAAAGLMAAGAAATPTAAMAEARRSLTSGSAMAVLERLRAFRL